MKTLLVILLVSALLIGLYLFCVYFMPPFLALVRNKRATVVMTERGLRRDLGRNKVEEIDWVEVEEVRVFTTADGPWSEDIFFAFLNTERSGVLVPQGKAPAGFVDMLRERFPGLNQKAFIEAMARGDDGNFLIWTRTAHSRGE